MKMWWSGLSLREQALLLTAGGLTALIILWYGLMSPALSARAEARLDRQQAADALVRLEHLVAAHRARAPAATGVSVSSSAAMNADAFKTEVTRTAQTAGLAISRLQGGEGDRFALVFEQADPRQFFYWLNEIETRLGARTERLSVDQAGDGRIRATVEVSGGAGS